MRATDGSYTTLIEPNATIDTDPTGINDSGQIVGYYTPYAQRDIDDGFLRNPDGTYVDLSVPFPGAVNTMPEAINGLGQIVGFYAGSEAIFAPEVPNQGFLRDVDGSYTTISDPSGVFGTEALGINLAGQIVGVYSDANGPDGYRAHAFIATPVSATAVPEPTSLLVIAAGCLGLCLARARWKPWSMRQPPPRHA